MISDHDYIAGCKNSEAYDASVDYNFNVSV